MAVHRPNMWETLDCEKIKAATDVTRAYAEEKGTAMTVERLAVCLGVRRKVILDYIARDEKELKPREREIQHLLRMACEEIAASHIEHGMMKGSNSAIDIMMLKNNLGYRDKVEESTSTGPVVIFGEEKLPD